jgi:hypothetical protein
MKTQTGGNVMKDWSFSASAEWVVGLALVAVIVAVMFV